MKREKTRIIFDWNWGYQCDFMVFNIYGCRNKYINVYIMCIYVCMCIYTP